MNHSWTRRGLLGTGIAALVITGSQFAEIPALFAQGQEVNIYSSRHYNTDKQLYDEFTRQTGIKVNVIEGEPDPLIVRIKSEGKNSPADVLLTADAGRLWRANQEGIFATVNSKTLQSKIPANLRDPQGRWFGFSKRARVIVYNKSKVKPNQVKTYADLTKPQWKGKVISRPGNNIYNQSLVAWMIVNQGAPAATNWSKGLVANFARPPQGNDTAQIEAVAAGVADLAIVNTYYVANLATNKDPKKQEVFNKVGVIFPDQAGGGTHINISGGGLVATAPNKAAGIKFLEYLASPKAQAFFAQANNEYPVVAGTPLSATVKSMGTFKESKTSIASYGPNLARALQITDQTGWK
ncbi:Fe(3+) ABC transporter substrate-binding protein [Synechocystis sp. LKSZ1]|uniref:Fe(3+) ABC transporter substrate-binding protein n=1 Tax=Synechocystis sp. LKSZ1 TaxID=3144951 RepID=UPI00336BB9A7